MQISAEQIEHVAKLVKFYLQFKNPYLKFILPLNRISAKKYCSVYKKELTTLYCIFTKYNIDIEKYIQFYVNILDKRECDIKTSLVNKKSIEEYIDWLKLLHKQDKIYSYFIKSVKNIANQAILLGYSSTKDFIRYIIKTRKISEYYISGQISIYYFAAIPNFKKIILKLDDFSKNEFKKLYDRFELYNAEITATYLKKTNKKVNPIQLTDELIFKLKTT